MIKSDLSWTVDKVKCSALSTIPNKLSNHSHLCHFLRVSWPPRSTLSGNGTIQKGTVLSKSGKKVSSRVDNYSNGEQYDTTVRSTER